MSVKKEILDLQKSINDSKPQELLGSSADVAYLPTQKVRLPMKYAKLTKWFFAPILGQPRGVDINQLRYFCQSTFVKICTQTIIDEVSALDWEIVPIDQEDETSYSKDDIERITKFFINPNRNNESHSHILRTFVRDLLEIDAAVIVKVFNSGDFEEDEYEEIPAEMYKMYRKDKMKGAVEKGEKFYMKKSQFRELGNKPIQKQMMNDTVVEVNSDTFELTEIYARDGGSFLKDVDLFGINYGYWQYSYMQPSYMPRWFDKKEIVYACINPRSEHAYGWAPIQSIMEVVESLNNSIRWNRDFFYNKAIPDGIIDFGNIDKDSLKALKAEWQKEIKGKAHKLLFLANPKTAYSSEGAGKEKSVTFTPFQQSAREMEFLSSQKWGATLVSSMFKCSPAEVGLLENVSTRATQEGQERVHLRKAVRPILDTVEYYWNTELMTEFFNSADPRGRTGGLKFQFKYIDPVDEAKQKENEIKDLEAGIITVNEVRRKRGMEEVAWGDEPNNKQPEASPPFGEGGPFGKERKEECAETKEEKDKKPKDQKKSKPIPAEVLKQANSIMNMLGLSKQASFTSRSGGDGTPGSAFSPVKPKKKVVDTTKTEKEVILEYAGYSGFLDNTFKKLKRKIYKHLETEMKDEVKKSGKINKSFSEFIRKMINSIFKTTFSDKFYNDIEGYVVKDLKIGMTDTEKALNVEVNKSKVDQTAKLLTDQQVNGYTMWDGSKFVGIKGAIIGVEKQIINNLNEAISKPDVTMDDLTKAVDTAWEGNEGIDKNRTLRIARTETSRIVNKGKIQGAIDTGLDVKKKWVVFPHKGSDACDALAKQKAINLEEWFVYKDEKYQHPPQHPNCRCGIKLVN